MDDAKLQRLKDKFELVDWYRDKTHRLYYAAYSADGLRWTIDPEPILLGCDTITLSQDPVTGEYLAFHKRQGDPRVVGIRQVFLSVSKDMEHWSEPQPVVVADELDNRAAKKLKGRNLLGILQPLRLSLCGTVARLCHAFPPGRASLRPVWQRRGQRRQTVRHRDHRCAARAQPRRPPLAPLLRPQSGDSAGAASYDAGSIFRPLQCPRHRRR